MRSNISVLVGPKEPLLEPVKRWKIAWFGHVTRRDSLTKTILQGSLEGGRTPWSAEEMLDGQHQRVDIPARAKTADKGPPAEKTGRGSLLNRPSYPPGRPSGSKTELN